MSSCLLVLSAGISSCICLPGFAQSYTISSFAATHHCFDVVPFDSLEVQTMSTVSDPFAQGIVRRTTRSFTFKDGVCTVIDHVGIAGPPSAPVATADPFTIWPAIFYLLGLRLPLESASLPLQQLPPRFHQACSSLISHVDFQRSFPDSCTAIPAVTSFRRFSS